MFSSTCLKTPFLRGTSETRRTTGTRSVTSSEVHFWNYQKITMKISFFVSRYGDFGDHSSIKTTDQKVQQMKIIIEDQLKEASNQIISDETDSNEVLTHLSDSLATGNNFFKFSISRKKPFFFKFTYFVYIFSRRRRYCVCSEQDQIPNYFFEQRGRSLWGRLDFKFILFYFF